MENIKSLCVDSDILIDYLRGVELARDFFIFRASNFNFCISVVSIAEIYSGKETKDSAKQKEMAQFLENFLVLPVTPEIAKLAGEIRRDAGKPFADSLIAASALLNSMTLVTRNVKHFQGIKDLKVMAPY